jgi:hypothetical protein
VRRWTVDQANAALERVGAVVEHVRAVTAAAGERAGVVKDRADGNGHMSPGREAAEFREAVEMLASEGIVLRDPQSGLVDFHAATDDGRDYWLCWIVGEPEVGWWHWPEDGFAGRKSLSDPPV